MMSNKKMFCRSVTFGVKFVEKLPQTENFFELTIPNLEAPVFEFLSGLVSKEEDRIMAPLLLQMFALEESSNHVPTSSLGAVVQDMAYLLLLGFPRFFSRNH